MILDLLKVVRVGSLEKLKEKLKKLLELHGQGLKVTPEEEKHRRNKNY